MNDRQTVDTITDEELDTLYRRINTLEHVAAGNKRHVQLVVPALEHAEAANARVRALADLIEAGAPWVANHDTLAARIREAVADRPPADGHVYLSTGCRHGDHTYCQSMTGLNGQKRPGECKKCGAKCICGCHQDAATGPLVDRPFRTHRQPTTEAGPREQRERPTHLDGTPYRYHEIKAEGWGHCDGCHLWGQWTVANPHECANGRVQPADHTTEA